MLTREEKNARRRDRYKDPVFKAKVAAWDKKSYEKRRYKILAQAKEYLSKNRDTILLKKKKYYNENKDKVINRVSEYRSNNWGKINAYFKKKYAEDPEYKKKMNARSATRYQVKMGRIKKLPCKVCGSIEKIHAHHSDYNDIYNVNWFCETHHLEHHREQRGS